MAFNSESDPLASLFNKHEDPYSHPFGSPEQAAAFEARRARRAAERDASAAQVWKDGQYDSKAAFEHARRHGLVQ